MSNYLALSGVTAMLQYNLGNAFSQANPLLPSLPTISCLAPDQVAASFNGPADIENQVNLFLHQVTHNQGWRNADLPSLSADGRTLLKSPPLALDLHYLLTVYGSDYWQAESLLGCAALALHDFPVMARADIAAAFQTMSLNPPPFTTLAGLLVGCGLADQIEMIKITPSTLGREEMAWLWTALKADYRPTYPFMVTVVLMQTERPVSVGLPVLHRNLQANTIQPAQILSVRPGSEIGATPGETIVAAGEFLGGVRQVVLQSDTFGSFGPIPVTQASNNSFAFTLTSTPQPLAGVYSLSGQILDTTGALLQLTNAMPIALAPSLPAQSTTPVNVSGGVQVNVTTINPPILERQTVQLSLSTVGPLANPADYFSASAPLAAPIVGSATQATFLFPSNFPTGKTLLAQLVVDGVASPVTVDWTQHPPAFTGPMVTT